MVFEASVSARSFPGMFNSTSSNNVVEGQNYWFRELTVAPGMCKQQGTTPIALSGYNLKFSDCLIDANKNLYFKQYACENIPSDGSSNPQVNIYSGYYNDASCTSYRAGEDMIYNYQTCNCLDFNCQYDCATTDQPWLDDPSGYISQKYTYDTSNNCLDEVESYTLKPNGCVTATYMDCPKAYAATYANPTCQGSPIQEQTLEFKDCKSVGGYYTTKCT